MMLQGKRIIVTGAESGIGRCIAMECARVGAAVMAAGLSAEGLSETVALIGRLGTSPAAMAIQADITRDEDVAALMSTASRDGCLDGVVANAGILLPKTPLIDTTSEAFERTIAVNLTGTFRTVRAAAQIMIAQGGGGSIIATGSSTVLRPMNGIVPYIASKGGVHAMMKAMALELAPHRIRCNVLVPGTTATPLARSMPGHLDAAAKALPMGEVVEPEELGRYAAFALSDALSHLTGTMLRVDAGRCIG